MEKDIFSRLQAFVIKQSCVDDEEITSETRLEDDLGIMGDDAVEFLAAYGKEFNVDLTQFMAADYFSAERGIILQTIGRWIIGTSKLKRKQLTVGHLEKGILEGRLDENVINKNNQGKHT